MSNQENSQSSGSTDTQSSSWETIMRQQLPDFARIAIMVRAGVKGQIALETEQQGQDLITLVSDLTGMYAKKVSGAKTEYELFWDEFIETQNPDPAYVIAYLLAALDYRELRLIVKVKQYKMLRSEIEKVGHHFCVVLARKGDPLPIDGTVYVIPDGHLGIAIFWEDTAISPDIEKILNRFVS